MTAPARDDHEWRRGWRVVAAGMVGIGTGPGLYQNLSSLFTPGMSADFGWSRGDIATAAGVGLLGAVAAPVLGRLVDRFGVRPMIVGAMLTLAATYAGLAAIGGALWQYQLLVLMLTLTVPGTSAVVYGKLIGAAFVRQRGLALGLATSGLSLTTLALPPAVGAVIALYGWRGGYAALGLMCACVALPLVLLALGRRADPLRAVARDPAAPATGMTGAQARRDTRFWRLALTVTFVNMATVGLVTQLVPFGLDRGLAAGQAALLLASFGASQIIGRLAMGALVDRLPPHSTAAAAALVSACGFGLLQLADPGFTIAMAAVFLAGVMHGAEYDLLPFFGVRLFGLRAFGEVYGMLLMIGLFGTGAGIVGFGRLYDATGGYAVALGLATAAMVAAAGLFASLGDRTARAAPAAA
jgi:predicted MFS family arabinose efflux permease